MRLFRSVRPFAVWALLALVSVAALAVQTDTWVVATRHEFALGEMTNVMLEPGGDLVLGFTQTRVATEETSLWCGAAGDGDTVWFGTGSGRVLRLTGDKLETVCETDEMLVTSLIRGAAGDWFAGTLPNGKVFHLDAAGKSELFCTLPAQHIWQLLPGPDGGLFAATGPGGKVFEIDARGRFRVAFDTRKENVLALAAAPAGGLWIGTAGTGAIYHRAADGKTTVLADLGDLEVRALADDGAGGVVAALNSGTKAAPSDFLQAISTAATQAQSPEEKARIEEAAQSPQNTAAPAATEPAPVVQSALVHIRANGTSDELHAFPNSYLTSLARDTTGAWWVTTNNSGRVFRCDEARRFSVALDLPESQVLALILRDGEPVGAATGNPGAAYRFTRATAAGGAYTSDVFDAKAPSAWGTMTWDGAGSFAVVTRSGNVALPDDTWSAWSQAESTSGFAVTSPAGRYFQYRFTWQAPESRLRATRVAFVPENQRPRVQDVQVIEQPDPNLLDGAQPPQPQPGKPLPANFPRLPILKVTWTATDPDNDLLVYRLFFRPEDRASWLPLTADPIRVLEANWTVDSLPEGWYRLKVAASDEQANPGTRALVGEFESARFLIDHGRPTFAEVAVTADGKVSGRALDSLGPVLRLEYRVASGGGTWIGVACADGIFDEASEEFAFDLGAVGQRDGLLQMRATDAAGNAGSVWVPLGGK